MIRQLVAGFRLLLTASVLGKSSVYWVLVVTKHLPKAIVFVRGPVHHNKEREGETKGISPHELFHSVKEIPKFTRSFVIFKTEISRYHAKHIYL